MPRRKKHKFDDKIHPLSFYETKDIFSRNCRISESSERATIEYPQGYFKKKKNFKRCPECGGLVHMPCLACNLDNE